MILPTQELADARKLNRRTGDLLGIARQGFLPRHTHLEFNHESKRNHSEYWNGVGRRPLVLLLLFPSV